MRFSICIPTYNGEKTIGRLLESILFQATNENKDMFEICISNNASTDDTQKIVEQFQQKYKFVKITCVEQIKTSDPAQNFVDVVQMARGTYCIIIGDDDWFVPNQMDYLLERLTIAESEDVDKIIMLFDIYDKKTDRTSSAYFVDLQEDSLFDMKKEEDRERYFSKVNSEKAGAGLFCYLSNVIFKPETWREEAELDAVKYSCYMQSYRHILNLYKGEKLLYLHHSFVVRDNSRDDCIKRLGINQSFKMEEDQYDLIDYFFSGEIKRKLVKNVQPQKVYLFLMSDEITKEKKDKIRVMYGNLEENEIVKKIWLPFNKLDKLRDKKIMLFGTGDSSDKAYEILTDYGLKIFGYFDNNKNLWGAEKNGVSIYNPQELIKFDNDETCLIYASMYLGEMYHQVSAMKLQRIKEFVIN